MAMKMPKFAKKNGSAKAAKKMVRTSPPCKKIATMKVAKS